MIRVTSHIEGTTVVVDAVIGANREAAHAFGLVVFHVHVGESRDTGGVGIKGVMARTDGRILARHEVIEVLQPVEGGSGRLA